MTTEQKQNIALAAEAAIIIYLLWKKNRDCKSSGGGQGAAAPPTPRLLPPILNPQAVTTTATASAPAGTTLAPETETAGKIREPRTGGIKPIRTNQPPPPPDEPNDLGYVPEPCPKGNGWYLCPRTTKCYPPKSDADPTIDYCGDGNTPTLQNFVNYVKESGFFAQKRSRFN